ncbi:MAG: glycosyl transferase family 2 [Rickettsiaceae bacterium]|jgi:glycosyltransferase involved in cell wall biosynthesis|nr:glycosyl transferase family 2 [Rickettsiaceae bacterium]
MNSAKISVFIITKNEADRISAAINSVKKIADEILVIDSGSEDKTTEIARNLGAKTFYNKWEGYGQQKVFGELLCKNKWILNIDADEELSEKVADEIAEIFSQGKQGQNIGYKVKIVNKFFGEKQPKKLAYYYNQLRLYNKDYCGFKDSSVHDSVVIKKGDDKNIGQLKNIIAHQSFRSIEHWLEKINSYSSMQAEDAFKKGEKASIFKILITPTFAFLKAYFIRRYFIYGFNGLIYSYIFAFGRLMKLVKIRKKYGN